jgi:hypothetical protein
MKISFQKKYFKQYSRETNYVHEPAPVTYQTFVIDGKKYLQIDSYTKKTDINEISPSKQSDHKLQFDKETAEEFIKFLMRELVIK